MQMITDGPSLHEVVYQQMHGCCWYCGVSVQRGRITLDHLIPVSRGGEHALSNIVASCRLCNTDKGSLTLEEYRATLSLTLFYGEKSRGDHRPPCVG